MLFNSQTLYSRDKPITKSIKRQMYLIVFAPIKITIFQAKLEKTRILFNHNNLTINY